MVRRALTNCSTGVGPGPGPVGTPGASDRALIATGSVNLDVPITVDALELTGGATAGSSPLTVTGELIWTFSQPGTFQFACLIPGHMEAGMQGPLTVN